LSFSIASPARRRPECSTMRNQIFKKLNRLPPNFAAATRNRTTRKELETRVRTVKKRG
jgi:hypothetical protein